LIAALRGERDPLPQRLMRPDLVVELEVGSDLLGELRRLLDLPLAEVLVLERAVEVLAHLVGLGRVVRDLDGVSRCRQLAASPGVNLPLVSVRAGRHDD